MAGIRQRIGRHSDHFCLRARTVSVSAAAVRYPSESVAAADAGGHPRDSRCPTRNGPANPPRLPIAFMNPIEAAAAESPSKMVGSTQNGVIQAYAEAPVSTIHTIESTRG